MECARLRPNLRNKTNDNGCQRFFYAADKITMRERLVASGHFVATKVVRSCLGMFTDDTCFVPNVQTITEDETRFGASSSIVVVAVSPDSYDWRSHSKINQVEFTTRVPPIVSESCEEGLFGEFPRVDLFYHSLSAPSILWLESGEML